jgi:galactose mutarotase-like enzyme
MVIKSTLNTYDVYTIISPDGQTSASFVPEKGGVGSSIIMPWEGKPRELLYQHDHFWERGNTNLPGGWPFIFPICARIAREGILGNYLYDGEIYNLPIHGFASAMPWQVTRSSAAERLTLTLTETEATLKCYPFHFRISLEYEVENGRLLCHQTYTNTGTKPMPYYAGFHPYFLTPPPHQGKEKVMLDYKPIRRFRYNEHLTNLIGTQELFNLPASIADPLINEQLVELGKNKLVTLAYPEGYTLHMIAEGMEDENLFPYVQLYTVPTEPFICAEPWMGFPNALNSVLGARWLQPRHSEHGTLQLWLE